MLQSTVSAPYAKTPIPPADFLPRWGQTKQLSEDERAARWEASVRAFLLMAKAHQGST